MERPALTKLLARLLRAARRVQSKKPRVWLDGRVRPEDSQAVDDLIKAGNDELAKKR